MSKEKKRKEALDRLNSLRSEAEVILDKAQQEQRKLTDEERLKYDSIVAEAEIIKMRFRVDNISPEIHVDPDNATSVYKRFAEQAASGQHVTMSVRAIQDEPSVHDASVPILYQELLEPLSKGLVVHGLGAHFMSGVQGEPFWPNVSDIEASVVGENEAVGESRLQFGNVKSRPVRISAQVPVSKRAINQSNLNLHNLVMRALGNGVDNLINKAVFAQAAIGSSGNQLTGPFVGLSGGQALQRAHATAITFEEIVSLEHAVLNIMTDTHKEGKYVMSYKMAEKLRTTPIVTGQSEMLLKIYSDSSGKRHGVMNGTTVKFSNYVPDGIVYYGGFEFLGIPQFGDISMTIDPISQAEKNLTRFIINTEIDLVKIRPEAFAMSKPKAG